MIKILGAALIVMAASGAGLSMAHSVRHEERCLEQLTRVLEMMLCEIPGRLSSVQELFVRAQECVSGVLKAFFQFCAQQTLAQSEPEISCIMDLALDRYEERLPTPCIVLLRQMGQVLGAYDAQEQVEVLSALSERAASALTNLRAGKADRCRSYEVLGVCAGCALAIILL